MFKSRIWLLILLSVLGLGAAEPAPELTLSAKVLKPGDTLTLTLADSSRSGRFLSGYMIFAFQPNVPDGLEKGKGVVHRVEKRKQDHCFIIGTGRDGVKWMARPSRDLPVRTIDIPLENWPAGDYHLTLQAFYFIDEKRTPRPVCCEYPVVFRLTADGGTVSAGQNGAADASWQLLENTLPSGKIPSVSTRCRITPSAAGLLFEAECMEPQMDKLKLTPVYDAGSTGIWTHDSVEFAVAPELEPKLMYKAIIDAAGNLGATALADDNTGTGTFSPVSGWNPQLQAEVKRLADRYQVKMFLPWGALPLPENFCGKLRVNVGRTRRTAGEECFTWSKLSGIAFDDPWSFRTIDLEPAVLKRFAWKAGMRKTLSKSNGLQITQQIFNRSGIFQAVAAEAVLTRGGKVISELSNQYAVAADGSAELDFFFPKPLETGKYQLRINFKGVDDTLLWQSSGEVEYRYLPLQIVLKNPVYRNAVFATMPDKVVRGTVVPDPETGNAEITVSARGKVCRGREFAFDTADWPEGETVIEAQAGKYKNSVVIRKLPYRKGEVFIDADNIIYRDGKRFLFFAWLHGNHTKPVPGFTGFHTYTHYRDWHHFQRCFMDRSANNRQCGLLFPYQEQNGTGGWKYFHHNDTAQLGDVITPEQRRCLDNFVPRASREADIFAWYVADEPEIRDLNPAWFEAVRNYLDQIDPWHPAIMLCCTDSGHERYKNGGDIFCPDYYPMFFEQGSFMPIGKTIDRMQLASRMKPSLGMIQAFFYAEKSPVNNSPGREPTYLEMRNQLYQVFAADCKGIILYDFYHNSQMYASTRLGPEVLAKETSVLKDHLLDPNRPGLQTRRLPENAPFTAVLKKMDKRFTIIAINLSDRPVEAQFHAGADAPKQLFVAAENRRVTLTDGSFRDIFAPYAVHVYTETDFPEIETVETTVRRIADFDRARFRKGNLMAVGALNKLAMLERFKGKFPAGQPAWSASSEIPEYYTANMGGLPYLFDGLRETELRDYQMCWKPMPDDKSPTLKLTLPGKSRVSRVEIYPASKTIYYGEKIAFAPLPRGTVTLFYNGKCVKEAEFAGGTLEPQIISCDVAADRVQIVFNGNGFALSEVEVYGEAE